MRMIVLVLIVSFLLAGCSVQNKESSSSYPSAVAWNNILYGYSIEEISIEEIGKEIGKIKRQTTPMPKKNGDSNDLRIPIGSILFEIKGKDPNQAIAIKVDDKYFKASKLGP
ncbi:hypothetical protein [Paenibacillus sp. ATY16]|uniref:hypothetical protein n=1 Tax=Paenibacillus sp. ATY16 TaxID=1759312 RepID=UPI000E2F9161|nr:hypothetical protein [Paenibacillus sp. ATY16]MCK9859351.1 hypothetical protein [Paenibacillus sp. ATY16]